MTLNDKIDAARQPRKLKVAFLGGGYQSAVGRVHRIAIELDQRFELTAGCFSRRHDENLASAAAYGLDVSKAYDNLEALITAESAKLDAIVILTPTNQHFEQVRHCLENGLAVICEKALVSSAQQATALKALVNAHKGFLAVTYNYTGYPILRELKQMVADGYLGRIQQMRIEMPQEGFLKVDEHGQPFKPQGWRLQDEAVPTVSLDLGVHLHMMTRFLTAEKPLSVVAVSGSYGNFAGVIDTVSCIAEYSNDLQCQIWYTKTALGHRNGLKVELYGEQGSAVWVQENPEQLQVALRDGERLLVDRASPRIKLANANRYTRFKAGHPAGFIEAFGNYYYDVADALLNQQPGGDFQETPYVFGVGSTLEGIHLLEAVAESSRSKQWVKVSHG
jgi:predicted dehydrogenase